MNAKKTYEEAISGSDHNHSAVGIITVSCTARYYVLILDMAITAFAVV